jgi:hypothetical protein
MQMKRNTNTFIKTSYVEGKGSLNAWPDNDPKKLSLLFLYGRVKVNFTTLSQLNSVSYNKTYDYNYHYFTIFFLHKTSVTAGVSLDKQIAQTIY